MSNEQMGFQKKKKWIIKIFAHFSKKINKYIKISQCFAPKTRKWLCNKKGSPRELNMCIQVLTPFKKEIEKVTVQSENKAV